MAKKIKVLVTTIKNSSINAVRGEFWVWESAWAMFPSKYRATDIHSIKILDEDQTKSLSGSLVGAAVGGTLAGKTGAVIGAMLGGNEKRVVIEVFFNDGHRLVGELPYNEYQKIWSNWQRAVQASTQNITSQQYEKRRTEKMYRLPKILWGILAAIILIGLLGQLGK